MSGPSDAEARASVRAVLDEIGDGESVEVCVAALFVGPNVKRIARVTDVPIAKVREYSRTLRANGIWVGGKVRVETEDGKPDAVEIALWSLVADGMLEMAS